MPVAVLLASSLACAAHASKKTAQIAKMQKSKFAKIRKPEVSCVPLRLRPPILITENQLTELTLCFSPTLLVTTQGHLAFICMHIYFLNGDDDFVRTFSRFLFVDTFIYTYVCVWCRSFAQGKVALRSLPARAGIKI